MISKQHCLLMFINVRAGIVSRQISDWLGVSAWLAMTLKSRLSTNHNAWKNSDVMLISKCTKSLVSVWRVLERDMSGSIFVFLQGIHALEQQKNYPGFFSNKNCIFSSWINYPLVENTTWWTYLTAIEMSCLCQNDFLSVWTEVKCRSPNWANSWARQPRL